MKNSTRINKDKPRRPTRPNRPKNLNVKKSYVKKKKKFNKLKLYRNLFFVFLIILAIFLVRNYFIQKSIEKQNAVIKAKEIQQEQAKITLDNSKKAEFFQKETTLLENLERFNQNLATIMNYPSSVFNIYPDSLNAVTAIKQTFSEYSQYLSSSEITNITNFINNLTTANNSYINDILAYNKNISSSSPDMALAKTQKAAVNTDYTNLNNLISQNQNIFQNQ